MKCRVSLMLAPPRPRAKASSPPVWFTPSAFEASETVKTPAPRDGPSDPYNAANSVREHLLDINT
jgi:hypothetical protein